MGKRNKKMSTKVTIVMYHYVRDLLYSRYLNINGLDVSLFKKQIQYIKKHYTIIKMEDLIDAIRIKQKLPNNSILLTFDDGYRDHFDFVFPYLYELGIQGSFFPSAKSIKSLNVLDVN
jgi:peptidoglycan/xylan/chitin deacetylase (PgdA/CDA1 family)